MVPPTSFAHVSSLVGLSEVTQLSLIKVAVFLACGDEPLLQFPWVDCRCAVNRGLRWAARRLLWFLLCEKGTISISYLVHICYSKLNESTGCLHGGLAIGIRLPESVHNIPPCDWVAKRLKKIILWKIPPLMAAGTNFYGRWCALGACLTGNRE